MTPANLTFTGLRDNFMSQWNWYDTSETHDYVVPTQYDNLYFVGAQSPGDHTYLPVPMTATPGTPEYMYMVSMGMPVNEAFQPNRNVTIPIIQNILPEVRGVHLVSNYTQLDNLTGHVSVNDGQRLGTLDLRTGFFDQLGAYSDLYIGVYFGFTGGTLNSTTDIGDVVHLTGNISQAGVAAGYFQPPAGGALTIGSTISIEGLGTTNNGSGLFQLGGNYLFDNEAGVVVNAFCTIQMGGDSTNVDENAPVDPAFLKVAVVNTTGREALYTLKEGSKAIDVGIDIKKGRIELNGWLVVLPKGKLDVNTTTALATITVGETGKLTLGGDSRTTINKGISVSGTLTVIATNTTNRVASIAGSLTINDSGLLSLDYFNITTPAAVVTTGLSVSGDVQISGKFLVAVDATTATSPTSSLLQVTGDLVFGANSTVIVNPYTTAGGDPVYHADQWWQIARAKSITNKPTAPIPYITSLTTNNEILRLTAGRIA